MSESVPPPSECHPWYADKPFVLDWINGKGPFAERWELRVPVMPPIRASYLLADPSELGLKTMLLTKRRAYGPAPYIGDPFCYMWYVATDQYGRHVGSDSWIEYKI